MITVTKHTSNYGCNACRKNGRTVEITFRSHPDAGCGIVISLCDDCIEELGNLCEELAR